MYETDSGIRHITRVFERAQYRDRNQLKPLIRDGNTIVIRLQGIDAPELHYRPQAVKGKKLAGTGLVKDYRQHQAETATARLGKFLQQHGAAGLPCIFITFLDDTRGPAEAVDKYGRFVGNIRLKDGTDINLWLLRSGLATIGLYNSMTDPEIRDCLKVHDKGARAKGGVLRYYTAKVSKFDRTLLYRRPTAAFAPAAAKETGRFVLPKIFRRQVAWWANKTAGNVTGNLSQFLSIHGAQDFYFNREEFLRVGRNSATPLKFAEILKNDVISLAPRDIVFKEAPSAIYRPGVVPKEITVWDF